MLYYFPGSVDTFFRQHNMPVSPCARDGEEFRDGLLRRIPRRILDRCEQNVGKINTGNDRLNDVVYII